ncbi:hypothetical protein A3Q56_00421 [Intoshia linei]|uniref:PDZ domain-containing protein n=1 Tax=Intoshia linei TaxID=1819745 RepID=A0A177BDY4_9BILA|nr:hypothetical protein A3Q56_00421 [Intoshia linei]
MKNDVSDEYVIKPEHYHENGKSILTIRRCSDLINYSELKDKIVYFESESNIRPWSMLNLAFPENTIKNIVNEEDGPSDMSKQSSIQSSKIPKSIEKNSSCDSLSTQNSRHVFDPKESVFNRFSSIRKSKSHISRTRERAESAESKSNFYYEKLFNVENDLQAMQIEEYVDCDYFGICFIVIFGQHTQLVVHKIKPNSLASRNNKIEIGTKIFKINGISISDLDLMEIKHLLKNLDIKTAQLGIDDKDCQNAHFPGFPSVSSTYTSHSTDSRFEPKKESNRLVVSVNVILRKQQNGFGFTLASQDNLSNDKCEFFVKHIYPDSSASQVDMKVGDQIQSIDGHQLENMNQISTVNVLRSVQIGDKTKLLLYRSIDTEIVSISLAGASLGIDICFNEATSRVFIKGIQPGSPASISSLQVNDQIIKVNSKSLSMSNKNALKCIHRALIHARKSQIIQFEVARQPALKSNLNLSPKKIILENTQSSISDDLPPFDFTLPRNSRIYTNSGISRDSQNSFIRNSALRQSMSHNETKCKSVMTKTTTMPRDKQNFHSNSFRNAIKYEPNSNEPYYRMGHVSPLPKKKRIKHDILQKMKKIFTKSKKNCSPVICTDYSSLTNQNDKNISYFIKTETSYNQPSFNSLKSPKLTNSQSYSHKYINQINFNKRLPTYQDHCDRNNFNQKVKFSPDEPEQYFNKSNQRKKDTNKFYNKLNYL